MLPASTVHRFLMHHFHRSKTMFAHQTTMHPTVTLWCLSKCVLEFSEVEQVYVGVGVEIRKSAPRPGIVTRPAENPRPVFVKAVVEKVQVKERYHPVAV